MIQRLYINNFRCLENFEWNLKGMSSALLIGKNGSGKSTIASALQILQRIGAGVNRVRELVVEKDFSQGRTAVPMRLEIDVTLEDDFYRYDLAFELPENFNELRVLEERLVHEGNPIYYRKAAQVTLFRSSNDTEAKFLVDWHLVALPIIQEQSKTDPIHVFKTWLSQIVILAPIPKVMTGQSKGESLKPNPDGSNIGEWLAGLLKFYPAAYTEIYACLREVMPDIYDFIGEATGKDSKSLVVRFGVATKTLSVDFNDLSDGEKCFFLCAVLIAASKYSSSIFCFWDEPDSHLSLSEIEMFISLLRRAFQTCGQFIATSHNEETIRKFSEENTFILDRKSHLEPTLIRALTDVMVNGDLVSALIRGDVVV